MLSCEERLLSHLLYAHNISLADFADCDYEALYRKRRRDANFAAAFQSDQKIHAFRDHLGIAPLYYRFSKGGVRFSHQLSDLVQLSDTLSDAGVLAFVKLGTARLLPLFDEIHIVPPATVLEIDPARRRSKAIYSYVIQPRKIPFWRTWPDLVDEFERLMTNAIKRCLQSDAVGLYLSGGIDSAMIGIILRKLGVKVRAYTSGPWGETSSDVIVARRNADLIGLDGHEIQYLSTDDYQTAMDDLPKVYGAPHGTSTALGVIKLIEQTRVQEQSQLFFGQNSDTVMAAMRGQYLSYLLNPLPISIRKRLHPALQHKSAVDDYLQLTRAYQAELEQLAIPQTPLAFNRLQKLIWAGMFIVETPPDSEVFTQPSLLRSQLVSSPYHDMDVVEFAMGLPLSRRVALGDKKLPILEKHLIQKLAIRYLPRDIVYRKKAFVVSFERDQRTRSIYESLPTEICGVALKRAHERFGADMLLRWLEHGGFATQELRGK